MKRALAVISLTAAMTVPALAEQRRSKAQIAADIARERLREEAARSRRAANAKPSAPLKPQPTPRPPQPNEYPYFRETARMGQTKTFFNDSVRVVQKIEPDLAIIEYDWNANGYGSREAALISPALANYADNCRASVPGLYSVTGLYSFAAANGTLRTLFLLAPAPTNLPAQPPPPNNALTR